MFQLTKMNVSGYKLIDRGNGLWQMQTPKGVFSGNMKQVCTYAVMKLDFSLDELETAVIEMEAAFHDAAEFGVLKSFMFTFDTMEKAKKENMQ